MYLSDAIVIMTSNVGSEHFRKLTSPLGFRSRSSGSSRCRARSCAKSSAASRRSSATASTTSCCSRRSARDEVRAIAKHHLATVEQTLAEAEQDAWRLITRRSRRWSDEGYSLAYGARFLKRVIDERIKLPISSRWRQGSRFRVTLQNGEVSVAVEASEKAEMSSEVATPDRRLNIDGAEWLN